jgi:hypothetical protein
MGSTTNFLAQNGNMPVVIIKDPRNTTHESKGRPYRFGVCFDNSRHAAKTLRQILMMAAEKDHIVTITIKDPELINEEKCKAEIASIFAEFGRTPEKTVFLAQEECASVYQRVKEFLIYESTNDTYIDFLACGNRGIHKKDQDNATMGSMATMALRNKRLNLIYVPCE